MADEPISAQEEQKVVAQHPLDDNTIAKMIESRKSAVPEEVPGTHFIVGIFDRDGRELEFADVTDDQDAAAYFFAKQFAKVAASGPEFNKSGVYRIVQNSEGAAKRKNYHLHVIVSGMSLKQLNDHGWEIRRLIDPDSFLIRK